MESSRIWQVRIPKMRSQFAASLYLCCFRRSLDAKGNHVIPCFSMISKSKDSCLTMHLILKSLGSIMTDAANFILFPFKVTLTSFQSNYRTSQSIFLFNLKCSGVNFPIILNRCMIPVVLHNFHHHHHLSSLCSSLSHTHCYQRSLFFIALWILPTIIPMSFSRSFR